MKAKGESHRIYWQQWLSSSATSGHAPQGRRELITSSAAIRISPDSAKAKDVTKLLRDTLNLSSLNDQQQQQQLRDEVKEEVEQEPQDSLVLVGTLYSLPRDYVQFEHEQAIVQQELQADVLYAQYAQYAFQGQEKSTSPAISTSTHPHGPGPGPGPTMPLPLMTGGEPFHVMKTLRPDDNPLQMRDKLMDHLRKLQEPFTGPATIAPKIQWYYVPHSSSRDDTSSLYHQEASLIPPYVDLDGYCTSMEEEEYESDDDTTDDDDDDDNDNDNDCNNNNFGDDNGLHHELNAGDEDRARYRSPLQVERHDWILSQCPWRRSHESKPNKNFHWQKREFRRYLQLASSQTPHRRSCISGYLMKQSKVDRHVWRRVHCVLTDDYLWYVTRIPYRTSSNHPEHAQLEKQSLSFRLARRHGRISLIRVLLLEPPTTINVDHNNSSSTTTSSSFMYRMPLCFELVSRHGISHVFRAPSRSIQQQWIQALSDRIVQRHENSLLEHAELIVADECLARNKRHATVAIHPLLPRGNATETNHQNVDQWSPIYRSVLRFGLQVAEYREQCRHVQAVLPAKQPIVVKTESSSSLSSSLPATMTTTMMTTTTTVIGNNHHANRNNHIRNGPVHPPIIEPLDPDIQALVQASWDEATTLLTRAIQVAMEVTKQQQQQQQQQQHYAQQHQTMPRSLETLCRHIDYVITGQFRSSSSLLLSSSSSLSSEQPTSEQRNGTSSKLQDSTHNSSRPTPTQRHDPPPMDLFDLLLAELQSIARD